MLAIRDSEASEEEEDEEKDETENGEGDPKACRCSNHKGQKEGYSI